MDKESEIDRWPWHDREDRGPELRSRLRGEHIDSFRGFEYEDRLIEQLSLRGVVYLDWVGLGKPAALEGLLSTIEKALEYPLAQRWKDLSLDSVVHSLPDRPQDEVEVSQEQVACLRAAIVTAWRGVLARRDALASAAVGSPENEAEVARLRELSTALADLSSQLARVEARDGPLILHFG